MPLMYPSAADAQQWANANGVSPDYVETYTAANDRLPANANTLMAWLQSLDGNPAWPAGAPQADVDAYVQQHLGPPRSAGDAKGWFQQQGMLDSSGSWTSLTLPSGQFYDAATGTVSQGGMVPGAPSAAPASPLEQLSAIVGGVSSNVQAHPIMWGGVAVLVVGGVVLWKHRR